ncbi:MAG TPA: hypothetical protein VMW91_04300 [Desulfosporosinus sp.]|nr:hypothetical protein [Desulfosporosinus sp.]
MSFLAKVEAGISNIVYHYTNLDSATSILKDDQFKLTFVSGSDDRNLPKNTFYYLSTTRSPVGSYHEGSYIGVLLKLNGQKLQHNYIGNPIDYWGPKFRKIQPDKNEMEDRIWSAKPIIKPALKYIEAIHIYYDTRHSKDPKRLKNLLIQAKRKKIPTFVYTDRKAAQILDTRKATPIKDLDLTVEPSKMWPSFPKSDRMASWVELYEKDKKDHLSENALALLGNWTGFRSYNSFTTNIQSQKKGSTGLYKFVDILKKEKWETKDFYNHVKDKWSGVQGYQ